MRGRRLGVCVGLILFCSALAIHAEVGLDVFDGNARVMLVMGITDDADPVGIRWGIVRQRAAAAYLNPNGDVRRDGFPELAWDPWGQPAVVWAYNNGTEHDVAFSRGIAGAWTPIDFLSALPYDELDPQMFISQDGAVHVVWWIDGSDPQVLLLRSLPATDSAASPAWLAPVRVNPAGETARRPTVALFDGRLRVAYERETGAGSNGPKEVVVRREETDGSFVVEKVLPSQSTDDLSPMLHADRGKVWLDWKYSATQFASSHFEGGAWGPISTHPWSDPSWVGIEGLRKSIGSRIVPAVQLAADPVGTGTPP